MVRLYALCPLYKHILRSDDCIINKDMNMQMSQQLCLKKKNTCTNILSNVDQKS